ncbi:hypothetical protein PP175_10530 [Aneurinibacillus sp. Ricciae_BoGa-3]|uniref:hypothetical protein n=1 Tax=Aneurinibacillus sp. Ricciae_BoGa-3 TaxID=3022697 RepID=UPI0023416552|nr:hypothetical protein [Aneurinibacillus sp. Ricciae_BoGa-3]WCK56305.1 hypothetical protein PP175_10530 [Aneurinibacillus sp. Ricciae_BoGa-3]
MIETCVPYLPNKLLIREYIWEKVNTKLYHRLNQIVGGQNPYAAALLDVQRQKKTLLNTLIQAFTLLKPALPEGIVQYHHDPHSLMNELMERQIELKVVYQSYSYFLGSSPSLVPVIESLQELHSRQVDLLLEWKKQFPKEKKKKHCLKE